MNTLDSRALIKLNHGAALPLAVRVVLPESAATPAATAEIETAEIEISELFRLLPKKRLVGITRWQGKKVIIKLFYQKLHWSRHLQREVSGLRSAANAAIPVPAMLASGILEDGRGGYLITEYLEGGYNLDSLVEKQSGDLVRHVGLALKLLAGCHRQGLWQQDIHHGNFMFVGDTAYLLDSAYFKTEIPGTTLSLPLRLANLGLFFAQFKVSEDSHVDGLMQIYNSELAEADRIRNLDELRAHIRQARNKRLDKYQEKLFRATSAFHWERTRTSRLLCDRRIIPGEFSGFSQQPDDFMDRGETFKAGNTTTVALVTINGQKYVLKRYNIKGPLHGLRRMLKASRASRSWRSGLLLEMLGVPTAKPLMMLERRIWWLIRRESYILFEYIEGDTIPQILASTEITSAQISGIFTSFQQFFETMRQYRFSHGDLKATNFIFTNNELVVLDLDATRRHRDTATFKRAFAKDLNRFVRSFAEMPELRKLEGQAQETVKALMG